MTHYLISISIIILNKGRILAFWVNGSCIQTKKQFEVQVIGILKEIDSFYSPKMHL